MYAHLHDPERLSAPEFKEQAAGELPGEARDPAGADRPFPNLNFEGKDARESHGGIEPCRAEQLLAMVQVNVQPRDLNGRDQEDLGLEHPAEVSCQCGEVVHIGWDPHPNSLREGPDDGIETQVPEEGTGRAPHAKASHQCSNAAEGVARPGPYRAACGERLEGAGKPVREVPSLHDRSEPVVADAFKGLTLIGKEDRVTESCVATKLCDELSTELEHSRGVLPEDGLPEIKPVRANSNAREGLVIRDDIFRQEMLEGRTDVLATSAALLRRLVLRDVRFQSGGGRGEKRRSKESAQAREAEEGAVRLSL
jgi:hypothetical protein